MMARAPSYLLFGLCSLAACGPEPTDFGPPPPNMTSSAGGQASSSSSGSSETSGTSETETETGGVEPDLPMQCDPLADPFEECGDLMRCDLATLTCVEALGTLGVDAPCTSTDDCVPGLACHLGYCTDLCNADADPDSCAPGQRCAAFGGIPGLCLSTCLLSLQDCAVPGQACNRGIASGELVAVCTGNTGQAAEGFACNFDEDCAGGFLCTPAANHSVACIDDASACCAAICELGVIACMGEEMTCVELDIENQPDAGFCGV